MNTNIAVGAIQDSDDYHRPPVVFNGYDPANYRGAPENLTKGDCPLKWEV